VTDHEGKLKEHLEYFPFGETWIQEENSLEIAFKFTAKELDSETGLYYFGARYYDPRTSVWASADPILDKYLPTGNRDKDAQLPGMGGIFNPLNLAMYTYGHQNPVKFTDPDGNSTWPTKSSELVGTANLPNNGGYFGYSRNSGTKWHAGIDIGGRVGDGVVAFKGGKVVRSSWQSSSDHHKGYGQRIVIQHEDGTFSLYGHLDSRKVKVGDVVSEGQLIGKLGRTGNAYNVPNAHLHFETGDGPYTGNGLENLDPKSQFTGWDKVKQFFRGMTGQGPMLVPDTHIDSTKPQKQSADN
jgi:RHS repeat-associated protein